MRRHGHTPSRPFEIKCENKKEVLDFIVSELNRSIKHVDKQRNSVFKKAQVADNDVIVNRIKQVADPTIKSHLQATLRQLADIENQVVDITFYHQLVEDNLL